MRKVTTINLNNNAYQIDEEGYDALRQYLENAERALANNPDRAEIMADLEQAIADKCRLALGQYKTVVSAEEIERILSQMGPVMGSAEESATSSAEATAEAAPGLPPRPRRFFRIAEGKMWSGVCNGLAAYAGVDVAWVRLAFVLLTIFSSGFWFLVYLILIFVVPVASTPEELSAAHGQPFNAQELVDRFRQKHEDFRAERRTRRDRGRNGHWFAAHPAAPAGAPARPPGPAARVTGSVMLPVFTALSASWFAAMAVAAYLVWNTGWFHEWHWHHGRWNWDGLPRWIPLLAIIALYILIALPISAGRKTALYYANGGYRHGWADAWSGLLWVALVALTLIGAWAVLPQLQHLLHQNLGWPQPWALASWN